MQLGGQLHGQAIDEFYQDLYDSNLRLNAELGAAKLRLQFARESVEQVRATNRTLHASLQAAEKELEEFRKDKEGREELERLSLDIMAQKAFCRRLPWWASCQPSTARRVSGNPVLASKAR